MPKMRASFQGLVQVLANGLYPETMMRCYAGRSP